MSNIFPRFAGSLSDPRLATRCAVDSVTVSAIFSLFCLRVVPVSVTSMMASTSSGGFASVAPNDRCICTDRFEPVRSHGVTISGFFEPCASLYDGRPAMNAAAVVRYSDETRSVLFLRA